ncbi:MAG: TcpQ domain-containing protein, partial [Bdellovibrionales bacterium]
EQDKAALAAELERVRAEKLESENTQIRALNTKLSGYEGEIKLLEQKLASSQTTRDTLEREEVPKLRADLSRLEQDKAALAAELERVRAEKSESENTQIRALNTKLSEYEGEVKLLEQKLASSQTTRDAPETVAVVAPEEIALPMPSQNEWVEPLLAAQPVVVASPPVKAQPSPPPKVRPAPAPTPAPVAAPVNVTRLRAVETPDGFVSYRIEGGDHTNDSANAAVSQEIASVVASVTPAVAPVAPASSPQWTALSKQSLRDVLQSWSQKNDVTLIWQAPQAFSVLQNIEVQGRYEEAVKALLDQYYEQDVRPVARLQRDPATGEQALIVHLDQG